VQVRAVDPEQKPVTGSLPEATVAVLVLVEVLVPVVLLLLLLQAAVSRIPIPRQSASARM
jgi:hypothetical protein